MIYKIDFLSGTISSVTEEEGKRHSEDRIVIPSTNDMEFVKGDMYEAYVDDWALACKLMSLFARRRLKRVESTAKYATELLTQRVEDYGKQVKEMQDQVDRWAENPI